MFILTTKGDTNIRSSPSSTSTANIIKKVPINTVLEVPTIETSQWAKVVRINGYPAPDPCWVASWVCNKEEFPDPPAPDYPDFTYDASTTSDQPIAVYYNNELVREFPAGEIRVVSKNPVLKLS